MKLSLLEIDKTGVARVGGQGEITIRDFADPGKNPLELVLGSTWATQRVLLNLEQVEFIDSSAIGWMIDTHRRFKDQGGRIIWYAPSPRVKDMIDLLKMRQLLDFKETEADARAAMAGEAPKPANP
jgi:anti-anti-sigma factor